MVPAAFWDDKNLLNQSKAWFRKNDETGNYDGIEGSYERVKKILADGNYDGIIGHRYFHFPSFLLFVIHLNIQYSVKELILYNCCLLIMLIVMNEYLYVLLFL